MSTIIFGVLFVLFELMTGGPLFLIAIGIGAIILGSIEVFSKKEAIAKPPYKFSWRDCFEFKP